MHAATKPVSRPGSSRTIGDNDELAIALSHRPHHRERIAAVETQVPSVIKTEFDQAGSFEERRAGCFERLLIRPERRSNVQIDTDADG